MVSASALPEHQARFRRYIHRRELPSQKFWIRCGGNHRGIISGQWSRGKVHRDPPPCCCEFKRLAQFAVGGDTSSDKQGGNIAGRGGGQSLRDEVVHHRSLKRGDKIECLVVAQLLVV